MRRRSIEGLTVLIVVLLLSQCERAKVSKFGAENFDHGSEVPAGRAKVLRDGKDYDAFLRIRGKALVVDFYADWCEPCQVLAPRLESIAAEFDGLVVIGKVDVDQSPALAHRLGVQGLPEVRFFRGGRKVGGFSGERSEREIRGDFQRLVAELEPAGSRDGG